MSIVHLLLVLIIGSVTADEAGWVRPNAWAISRNEENPSTECDCNCNAIVKAVNPQDVNLASNVYLKLVNYMFNKKHLTKSEFGETYWIDWHMAITADELRLLSEATRAKDFHGIDSIVSEVLHKSRSSSIARVILNTWKEYYDHYISGIWQTPERMTAIKFMAAIFFVYLFSKRYKYSVILVSICTILVYSYYITYLKCNHELTIEELGKIMRQNEKNPCEISESFWSSYFSSKKDNCVKHMKKMYAKHDYECTPLDVAMQMISEVSFKQLSLFIDHIGDKMQVIMNVGFPYNIVLLIFFLCLIVIIFKSIIKNLFRFILSPSSWASHHAPPVKDVNHDTVERLLAQIEGSCVENIVRIEVVTSNNKKKRIQRKAIPQITFTAVEECRDDEPTKDNLSKSKTVISENSNFQDESNDSTKDIEIKSCGSEEKSQDFMSL